MIITDDGEINFHIPCGGVFKVHPTPVHALVRQLNVVDQQLGGMRRGAKVRPIGER